MLLMTLHGTDIQIVQIRRLIGCQMNSLIQSVWVIGQGR